MKSQITGAGNPLNVTSPSCTVWLKSTNTRPIAPPRHQCKTYFLCRICSQAFESGFESDFDFEFDFPGGPFFPLLEGWELLPVPLPLPLPLPVPLPLNLLSAFRCHPERAPFATRDLSWIFAVPPTPKAADLPRCNFAQTREPSTGGAA